MAYVLNGGNYGRRDLILTENRVNIRKGRETRCKNDYIDLEEPKTEQIRGNKCDDEVRLCFVLGNPPNLAKISKRHKFVLYTVVRR